MRVAFVHDWLSSFGGAEQVLLSLCELFPEAPIYTAVYSPQNLPQFRKKKIITSFVNQLPSAPAHPQVYLPFLPFVFEGFHLSEYDLVISDAHCFAKGVITRPETLHICYCHTPTRYLWLPWIDDRLSSSWLKKLLAFYLRIWDFQAAQRVDCFIANSKTVAQRIKKYYRREARVIYPPVKTSLFQPVSSRNQLEDYYLFVGRLVAYKKPDLVVEAFNRLKLPLKIVGTGPLLTTLKRQAKKNIQFLGYLPEEEMREVYAKALAFVFPAEEDFGLGPVEAMAAGRPVIAYRRGGGTETVIEGETGEFFEQQKVEVLVEKIKSFQPERYDPQKIRQRAEEFDERVFQKKIKEYIQKEWLAFQRGER